MHHREVTENDIPEICKLPKTREELFYCFPRASFPLSETDLRQCIEMRSDSTVVEVAGRVVAFANFYRWKEGLCSIGNVVVASEVRGSGVGSYLINHMLKLGSRSITRNRFQCHVLIVTQQGCSFTQSLVSSLMTLSNGSITTGIG